MYRSSPLRVACLSRLLCGWVLAMVAFWQSLAAGAATYFVSTDGNDGNPGTEAQPWRTISYAIKHGWPPVYLQPGDTLVVRGGIYRGNDHVIDLPEGSGVSGLGDAPITVMAYTNETPIITGVVGSNYIYYACAIKGKSWWKFDGLVWSNNFGEINLKNCTNFVFTNCVFGYMPGSGTASNDPSSAAYTSFSLYGSSQLNRIQKCIFAGWGMISTNSSLGNYKLEGSPLVIGNETDDDPTWYNLIENCQFYNGGHDLFELVSAYNVFRGNDFHNEGWIATNAFCHLMYNASPRRTEGNPYGRWGARITKPGDAGTRQIDQRNVFEYNRFHYAWAPADSGGAFGIELATQRSIYRFNTVAYTLAAGVFFNTSGQTTRISSNAFYGNVIFSCGLSHVYGGKWMQSYSYGLSMNTFENRMTGNYVVNNIIYGNHPGDVDPNCFRYQVMRTNWIGGVGLPAPQFVNTNGFGDPFRTNNAPLFSLQTNSPCIDAGTWLAYVTSPDGTGNSFTVDNAHYFSDGNKVVRGDSIQLQGQTNRVVLTGVQLDTHTLVFDSSLTWTNGQGVSLPFSGSAPDMGAFERSIVGAPGGPRPK